MMKKTILLANIGNRNIKYGGEFIEKKDEGFFEFTKMLFESIETEKDDIEILILHMILKEIKIDKIYLFATNQNHHQDTFFEAKIIQYILKDKYEIEIVEVKQNPTKRDDAFLFYENFFSKHKEFLEQELVISGSGGVPAMKEALNFLSIVNFSNNSKILDVGQFDDSIIYSNADKEYLKNIDKKTIGTMIKKYDYFACYDFYKQSKLKNKYLEHLLQYLGNRFNFNFKDAKINLKNLGIKSKIFILPNNNQDLILELIQNIEISFAKGEYAMVIGKVFSLHEGLIKYLFEDLYFNVDDFDKYENIGVKVSITSSGEKYININSQFEKIKEKYKDFNSEQKDIFNCMQDIVKLKGLRNGSIIAHGFGGISQSDAKNMIIIIKKLKIVFGIKNNIFNEINNELLSYLK